MQRNLKNIVPIRSTETVAVIVVESIICA